MEEEPKSTVKWKDFVHAYNSYCAKSYIKPASSDVIAKIISKLFPNAKHHLLKNPHGEIEKITNFIVYDGLRFRTVAPASLSNVQHTPCIILPSICSSKYSNGTLHINVPTEYSVNKKPLVYNILIQNQNLRVKLHDRFIMLDKFGIDTYAEISQVYILSLIKIVQSLTLCRGKEKFANGAKTGLEEVWVKLRDQSYHETRIRAIACKLVLPFTAGTKLCHNCNLLTLKVVGSPPCRDTIGE